MRYARKFAIVVIEQVEEDLYRVTDGNNEYYINKETLEKDYEEI